MQAVGAKSGAPPSANWKLPRHLDENSKVRLRGFEFYPASPDSFAPAAQVKGNAKRKHQGRDPKVKLGTAFGSSIMTFRAIAINATSMGKSVVRPLRYGYPAAHRSSASPVHTRG